MGGCDRVRSVDSGDGIRYYFKSTRLSVAENSGKHVLGSKFDLRYDDTTLDHDIAAVAGRRSRPELALRREKGVIKVLPLATVGGSGARTVSGTQYKPTFAPLNRE